jgi:anti-anti-sigma factor
MDTPVQMWKGTAFNIERIDGNAPGTVIFRMTGPFTARDMYGSLTPLALEHMLNFQSTPDEVRPAVNILDLTEVPYMDSKGLGMVVNHHTNCQGKGVRLVVAGATPRVQELFTMTKVDTILSLCPTVEEADIS